MAEFEGEATEALAQGTFSEFLLKNKAIFKIDFSDDSQIDSTGISESESLNFESLDIEEDKVDINVNIGEPFKLIAERMKYVTDNGKIKKLVIKEGYGTATQPKDVAWVNYCFYLEGESLPFDSTYSRDNVPIKFDMAAGDLLIGLELALLSMKVGEKAQFLIHHDYGFGKKGLLDRVPPNSTIFAVVHLVKLSNKIIKSKDKSFETVYEEAKLLYKEATQLINDQCEVMAKSKLSTAERKLVDVRMNSSAEDSKRKLLLCDIYMLLLKCLNHPDISKPKLLCCIARDAINLMPSKVTKNPQLYYQRAIAYITLGDYEKATTDLIKAKKLAPHDQDIDRQFLRLERKKKYSDEKFVSFEPETDENSRDKIKSSRVSTEFVNTTYELLQEFKNGEEPTTELPDGLSEPEINIISNICETLELFLVKTTICNHTTYTVHKNSPSKH